jgi:uncharacterized protein
MIKNDTAILLFSRSANAEAVAKPLTVNARSSRSVASFLINRSKKIAERTQLPVFNFTEKQQRGTSFGERFAHAFEAIFALGFDKVIAIGNDCLTVETSDILTTAKVLQTTPSVLGATKTGGAYLIGLQKTLFQKEAFQNIHWQTKNTFPQIVQFIDNQLVTPYFLPEKSDINQPSDWCEILPKIADFIYKTLIQCLQIGRSFLSAYVLFPINHSYLATSLALRAPPSPS